MKERLKRLLFRRRAAYAALKSSPDGKVVLADLARFCRHRTSTYKPGLPAESIHHLEGRREVFLRLVNYGDISDEEIDRMIEEEVSTHD